MKCDLCQQETTDGNDNMKFETTDSIRSIKTLKLIHGGDWEYLARVLRLTGANGRQFCLFCLVPLLKILKGQPRAAVYLPAFDCRLYESESNAHTSEQFETRTVQQTLDDHQEFLANGGVHKQASKFHNCEHFPLIPNDGKVIELVSSMPLHISLGLGLVSINLVEDLSIKLDLEIRKANGIPCELHREYLKQKKDLVLKSVALFEQIDEFKSFKHAVEEEKDSLVSEHPDYFAKNGRSFVLHSAPAVTIRKQAKELENRIATFNTKNKSPNVRGEVG